jgi:hypothetical protein
LHLPVAATATWILCALMWFGKGVTRAAGVALLCFYAAYLGAAILVS